jgi:rubrerythrin
MEISFESWRNYFLQNKKHFSHITKSGLQELTAHEKKLLTKPIQQFQRGESSEGFHLLLAANMYNAEYGKAVTHFIKEEQKHAAVLACYMRQERIPSIKNHWTDSVFRNLRKYFGVQHTVMVLLSAEIIATVFYRALHNASSSRTLQKICTQIMSDEEMHINFQSFALQHMRANLSKATILLLRLYQIILMTGTSVVVWLCYYEVFKAGGYSLSRYVEAVKEEFVRADKMTNGNVGIEIRTPVVKYMEEEVLI